MGVVPQHLENRWLDGRKAPPDWPNPNERTPDPFDEFEQSARDAIALLGLTDWRVTIERAQLDPGDAEVRARVYLNFRQRAARLAWNMNHQLDDRASVGMLSPAEAGVHEVLHLALNALVNIAAHRGDPEAMEVDGEEHALIQRLLPVVMRAIRGPSCT